ncbi:MAG: TIGR03557 family F420-dependent LLM class oxidoreductase [Actinobacteria bacterium]|nr:TIGR03557 family F420-dependent LLM class oxidoreductase [Actinomycetota bacterium]
MKIGYFLSCEEYSPAELLDQARWAEAAGFEFLWISDHFHPWNDAQGESPFVWSMIGAISSVCSLPITTAVTCPIIRQHPVLVAQAAATCAVLTGGRFTLGVGTGEALNEHVTGARWPNIGVRLEMLEEAVTLMRALWNDGFVDHHGTHYTVENARIYTRPEQPVPVYVSGFGPKAVEVAGRIGDGFVTTSPDQQLLSLFRRSGGQDKPTSAGYKVCWGPDDDACLDIAHRLWANSGLPGELSQVLPSPAHIEQASSLVARETTRSSIAYGQDVDRHVAAFKPYADAGIDVVHISQMGGRDPRSSAEGFFEFYRDQALPRLRELAS